jgi:hypothetical protein
VRDPRGEQESGLPPELPDDPVRLALYVFVLRDRPVRNTRITSDDAGILERLETRGKGRRDWINLLISTSRHRRTCSSAQNIRQG